MPLAGVDPVVTRVLGRTVSFALTLLALLLVYRLVVRVVDRLVVRREIGSARVRTLGALVVNLTRWLLGFVVLVMGLTELGVDVRALLVSAGLVGVAVGFGAQSLVRDVISGLFLLFEGVVAVGDLVEVSGNRGTVESIGLRLTRLRQADGSLRIVPNGQLNDFVNLTGAWAVAAVEVTVARDVDATRAQAALERAAATWARESGAAVATPEAHGIMKITGGEVVLRLTVNVDPTRRVAAESGLRRRIKDAFDHDGIALVGVS